MLRPPETAAPVLAPGQRGKKSGRIPDIRVQGIGDPLIFSYFYASKQHEHDTKNRLY